VNFVLVQEQETTGRALVVVPQRTTAVVAVSAPSPAAGDEATAGAASGTQPQAESPAEPAVSMEVTAKGPSVTETTSATTASSSANGAASPRGDGHPLAAAMTNGEAAAGAVSNGEAPVAADVADTEAMASLDQETIAYLRSLKRGDGPSVLERAIGVYLDQAPTALEELRRCVAAGDASAVWRIAHSLKSSSASLGAKTLAQHMSDMESRARENDLNEATTRLEQLESEFKKVSTALETTLREEKESCLKSA
jgi:HPt (histidine-containing phosphotransfer) domain-containing protein